MKKIRNCLVWLIVFALKLITVPFFFFGWIFIAILTFFHWVIDLLSTREDEEFYPKKKSICAKLIAKTAVGIVSWIWQSTTSNGSFLFEQSRSLFFEISVVCIFGENQA